MKKAFPLTLLVVGLILLFLGFEAKDSIGSAVSEVVNDAPSNKAIILMVSGGLVSVIGLTGLLRK